MFYDTALVKVNGVWESAIDAVLDEYSIIDDVLRQNDEYDRIEALLRAYGLDEYDVDAETASSLVNEVLQ